MEEFLSEGEGAARSAAKRLTRDIENWLIRSTINAPDWLVPLQLVQSKFLMVMSRDTLYSARMARDLLWPDEKSINLKDFVDISQTYVPNLFHWSHSYTTNRLVDLLSNPDLTPNAHNVKRRLLEYYSLLESARLTNSVLSSLPLPRTLDPNQPVPLPSRLYTLMILFRDTLALAIRLPFFLFPLIVHLPVYILSRLGAQLAEDEVESQAQNKVVIGLILLVLFIYPTAFFLLWAFMMYTPLGALISAGIVWLLAVYHNRLIRGVFPLLSDLTTLTMGRPRPLRTGQTFVRRLAGAGRCLDSQEVGPGCIRSWPVHNPFHPPREPMGSTASKFR
jgi:glycerol-3-phosphate O-acyltransferase/dihydroxyacetone phosphate acyltransferase